LPGKRWPDLCLLCRSCHWIHGFDPGTNSLTFSPWAEQYRLLRYYLKLM